jgi:serine/threonine protein kinase
MNQICPTDDQLLAVAMDEPDSTGLREHVDQCADCQARLQQIRSEIAQLQNFVSQPTVPMNNPAANPARESPIPISSIIDRYVVVANLGSGGQADVYRVIDPNLGRQLVLKLSRHASNPNDARRELQLAEGRLLADLDHPGIVRVFDVGVYHDRPYLVLEYVAGRNLEQTYAANSPLAEEAARLVSEVASAVAYAHRRGIVHGDITPRNILIDVDGHARLIDFGLSKFEDAWGERQSISGGTPEFLPPESISVDNRLQRTGPAGDVFGLAAALYWLLTGQPPFPGATNTEILQKVKRCAIDFDALRNAKVPGRIARICQQALNADPSNRPTAQILEQQLRIAVRPRVTRWVVATVVGLLLLATSLFVWQFEFTDSPPDDNANVIHSSPNISVFREDGIRILSNELPLRSGDRIAVWCNLSRGKQAVLVWFNAAGEVKQLEPIRDVVGKLDRLVYPAPRRSFSLESPEGTEMFFFCRGEAISEQELKACFPIGSVAPKLPEYNWLILQRSEVKVEGRLKDGIPDEIGQIEGTMKEIDRQLRRHFEGVSGIAFPHRREED